jgi:hypothetical protein
MKKAPRHPGTTPLGVAYPQMLTFFGVRSQIFKRIYFRSRGQALSPDFLGLVLAGVVPSRMLAFVSSLLLPSVRQLPKTLTAARRGTGCIEPAIGITSSTYFPMPSMTSACRSSD